MNSPDPEVGSVYHSKGTAAQVFTEQIQGDTLSRTMSLKKLLVADDSLTIQKVIKLALSNEGYEIQAASTGTDAIQQILLWKPNLVLIDISLPDKSAFDVKKTINSHSEASETRFVLMSSAFEDVNESLVQELEFHGRLVKPFDPGHLRKILQEASGKKSVQASRKRETSSSSVPPRATPPSSFVDFEAPPHTPNVAPSASLPPLPTPLPELDLERPISREEPPPPFEFSESEEVSFLAPPPLPEHEEVKTVAFQKDELWNEPSSSGPPPITITIPNPSESEPMDVDSDIRSLTASTIKMSGMDHFEWGIQETAKKEFQTPPPLPTREPTKKTQLVGDQTLQTMRDQEPVLAPPPAFGEINNVAFEKLGREATKTITRRISTPPPAPEAPSFQVELEKEPEPAVNQKSPASAVDLHSIVENEVRKLIEKEVQKLLPDLMEKMVRQEINRLLSDRT